MGLERKMWRGMFAPKEVVELRQMCFTPERVFAPGKYTAAELPDTAFEMGLVEQLPPVSEQNTHIENTKTLPKQES